MDIRREEHAKATRARMAELQAELDGLEARTQAAEADAKRRVAVAEQRLRELQAWADERLAVVRRS